MPQGNWVRVPQGLVVGLLVRPAQRVQRVLPGQLERVLPEQLVRQVPLVQPGQQGLLVQRVQPVRRVLDSRNMRISITPTHKWWHSKTDVTFNSMVCCLLGLLIRQGLHNSR